MKTAMAVLLGLTAVLCAQTAASVRDGVYTNDQASRGAAAYKQKCASCHGPALEGVGQSPPLSGDDFKANWSGKTLGDLFDEIQATMPADHPGTLSRPVNAQIIAFILKSNEFPDGKKALPADSGALQKIGFDAAKPKQ